MTRLSLALFEVQVGEIDNPFTHSFRMAPRTSLSVACCHLLYTGSMSGATGTQMASAAATCRSDAFVAFLDLRSARVHKP